MFEIDITACRGRQNRLLAVMNQQDLELVVVTQAEHVQYLSGCRIGWQFQPAAALDANGKLTLIAPNKAPDGTAADEIRTYQAQKHSTLRNDQRAACSEILAGALAGKKYQRIGVEFSSFGVHLQRALGAATLVDVEPDLYTLRRRKDGDELARIRKAIAGTGRMYTRAREVMAPGVSELQMFNELQACAVEEFGEMISGYGSGTGNDYQCAARGGPPRGGRVAGAGELYILDLGPAFRGYFADNCRTIAVTKPDGQQQEAWSYISQVFAHVEKSVRPGKSCRELFVEAQQILDKAPCGTFDHHLGHGIGLFPHEGPHLNPNWDDVFAVGDVFTVEPGLYAPELRAGMRIENDYLVTENGVENLSDFPMGL